MWQELQPHFDRRGRHEGQGGGGALLSPRTMSLANTVVQWAKTMTWQGLTPIVQLATATYERGKRIGKQAFAALSKRLQRSQTLPRWSVVIEPLREGLAPSG